MAIFFGLPLLLAAELLLRVYHQHTRQQRLPTELRAETRTLTWKDIKNKYRIVCFGDSITFGEGLPYEQTYPAILARMLRQRHPDLNVAVINAGICGHTSVQGLARLQRDVLWYRPHAVLVAFGLNDGKLGYWPLDPGREHQICGNLNLKDHMARLLDHSHIYLTLRARSRRWLSRLSQPKPSIKMHFEGELQPRVSKRGFEIALNRMIEQIKKSGCALLLLMTTTPVGETFNPGLTLAQRQKQKVIYVEYNNIIRAVAARCGAYLLDLHNIFINRAQTRTALLTADGVHLTSIGEHLVAISALQALEEKGLPGSNPYRGR